MIGNAWPIRFSRRIKRNTRNLPVRVSPKRKIRKLTVKKRASGVNSSLLKAKVKVGKKNKLEETPNQASEILKPVSRNFKPVIRKSPRLSISKVCNKKGKTRNSLQTSLVYLKNNKTSLKNLELADNSKKVIEKKNCKKFVNEEKQSVRKNLRLSKSLPKEKGKNKELHDSDLKPSKEKPSQRKSTKQVTTLSSGLVLTPNLKRCTHIPKLSGRKKSARLSIEPQNQEISVHMPASKLLALTPVPGKVTRISRHSGNRKSLRLPKEPQNQGIFINPPASKLLAVTPVPGKVTRISRHPENRKSARLSKESQNQEIFINTPASKLLAVTPVPGKVTRLSRHSGNRKSGRFSKEPIKLRIMDSETSLNTSLFFSLLETPQPEKHPEKRKSSRSLEPSPLRTLNKELPLSTPAYLLTSNADSTLSKSSKSCKSAENLLTESCSRKQSKSKVFAKSSSTVSHEKRKQKVNQHQKTSKNFKKPLSNETENLPLDTLTTPAFKPPCGRGLPKKYLSKSDSKNSKRKLNISAAGNQIVSEELHNAKKRKSADFSKIPAKGTLKRKRWLLNNLKEKNGSYEDDIFENKNFDLYKQAFHFGDESDGSSVNIATPKFDCILTPALPKKTPRYKDCYSPTEFLQARKTAEEYLHRRNKKRKSGDRPPSSGKKPNANKKKTVQEIPEKKKLDFEEAVNKLIAVQKNLEIEAEVEEEEEDSYFSDVSN